VCVCVCVCACVRACVVGASWLSSVTRASASTERRASMVLMPSCAAVSLGLHSPRSGTVPSWRVNADRRDEDEPTQAPRRAGDTQPNIGQRKRVLFAVSSGPAVGAGAAVPRPYDAPPPAPRAFRDLVRNQRPPAGRAACLRECGPQGEGKARLEMVARGGRSGPSAECR